MFKVIGKNTTILGIFLGLFGISLLGYVVTGYNFVSIDKIVLLGNTLWEDSSNFFQEIFRMTTRIKDALSIDVEDVVSGEGWFKDILKSLLRVVNFLTNIFSIIFGAFYGAVYLPFMAIYFVIRLFNALIYLLGITNYMLPSWAFWI